MQNGTQELDFRTSDGIDVSLLWSPHTNGVTVAVVDHKTGDDFSFSVPPDQAADAFNHPFAYA